MCDSLHLNKRVYLSQDLLLSPVLLHFAEMFHHNRVLGTQFTEVKIAEKKRSCFDLIVIVLSDEIEPSSLRPRHGFGGRGCGAESLPNQYKLYICINSDEIYDIKLLCCALKKRKSMHITMSGLWSCRVKKKKKKY